MTRTVLLAGRPARVAAPAAEAEPVNGRIAFTTFESSADPAAGDIWTISADGADKRQAVFDPGYDAQSDWSPDGNEDRLPQPPQQPVRGLDRRLLGARPRDRSPARGDVAVSTDGSETSQPAWFRDGTGLIYAAPTGRGQRARTCGR